MHYCIHHLNDLSGSPLILREYMKSLDADEPAMLITNTGQGFLSDWEGPTRRFGYTKHKSKALRFVSLSIWYVRVILYLLFHLSRGDRLTCSTLISSPLLIVPLLRRSVTAELMVNEVFFRVPGWRSLGLAMANSNRVEKVYLSKFVRDNWSFRGPARIVYPNLRSSIIALSEELSQIQPKDRDNLTFFLVGSQIEAKGYKLFIEIARYYESLQPGYRFALYLSGDPERFSSEYPDAQRPNNLSVEFNNSSPEIFAGKDIFLGLTNPEQWVETFGQTFAEAMALGNIVVIPPVGAQLEYVTDGDSGFVFQDYSVNGIVDQIGRILEKGDLAALASRSRSAIRAFYDFD